MRFHGSSFVSNQCVQRAPTARTRKEAWSFPLRSCFTACDLLLSAVDSSRLLPDCLGISLPVPCFLTGVVSPCSAKNSSCLPYWRNSHVLGVRSRGSSMSLCWAGTLACASWLVSHISAGSCSGCSWSSEWCWHWHTASSSPYSSSAWAVDWGHLDYASVYGRAFTRQFVFCWAHLRTKGPLWDPIGDDQGINSLGNLVASALRRPVVPVVDSCLASSSRLTTLGWRASSSWRAAGGTAFAWLLSWWLWNGCCLVPVMSLY